MKKKVLITGGSGLLGINLAYFMKDIWDISLFCKSKLVELDGVSCTHLNLSDEMKVYREIEKFSPDIIIHTAGLTNVEYCEKNYFQAYESNVLASRYIAKASKLVNAKLVHISTDHFCSQASLLSDENQIDIPINNYAKTKLDAEFEVKRSASDPLIVRTNFYGWGHKYRKSFSDVIINSLRKKKTITLFDDVYYTPIYVEDLIKKINLLVERNAEGIFNIVGPEKVSKYEFGLKVAKAFDLNVSLINKGSIKDIGNLVNRPLNMSLSNEKAISLLNTKFLTIEESLELMKQAEFVGVHTKFLSSVSIKEEKQIHYGKQFIDESDINSVIKTLNGNFLTQGPKVQEFEDVIAKFVGAKYAVAVSNWTCGLHIACLAAGVLPGDSVITSPLSFVASSNCAVYSGAIPAFADINIETLNLDPIEVERKCKELGNVKAIIPVHFAGHPCDMQELKKVADKYGAVIIEDAAHALGGNYLEGGKIGSCSNSLMCGFSFHPVKNIATGEGSIITTNSTEVYKQLLRLRSHGIIKGNDPFKNDELAYTDGSQNSWYYEMQQIGYNYRITDIQCSLGISQMNKLEGFLSRRIEVAKRYDKAFSSLKHFKLVQNKTRDISGNHLYVAMINYEKLGKSRAQVFKELSSAGVSPHVHYIPIPLQPYYAETFKIPLKDYSNSLIYYNQAITLPLFPSITDEEVDLIISQIVKVLS
ncbi:UDP-4-amino-4,6-dideoxy-N-acetyl-beta-L-altrosamine transaminase [Bacteriovorax sp. Seq25_V]|uniref:UDP-4-amino-4, 6-dideoxy-N-acetyl-beta-L-altrosamine transaminase n=1 Tax=Bacteriovorax sp. Seq25_V TaxID=1201288 RepID=UPI00038A27F0|nr:UDP-4-amino-4,6-dideoxy-N-acetyl-beta-L-altrosamine transaminase [Bacteriovorax sp. Seq25_V]EQC43369.1 UDP-4-keto-6-deoxy-N-acetylglucosamine 4-aminotransferase [Bacteriovorax sp. Seq25_V]